MHLQSGKVLNIMTKSANTDAYMSSQSLQSSSQAQITLTLMTLGHISFFPLISM